MKQPEGSFESLAHQFAVQYELGIVRVPELISAVESVVASDIWARSTRAANLYAEIPFESFDSSDSAPTITRGVIDLCFEEPNGWVIVDYKTDDISASDLEAATNFYAPQLQSYAEFWQSTTGKNVSEIGVYFTKLSTYQTVRII